MKKLLILLILVVIAIGSYQIFTLYDNRFAPGRMRETDAVRPHEEPLLIMSKDVVPFDGGEAKLRATPHDELFSPFTGDLSGHIEQGKSLYLTYCAQCHGRSLDGNGTVGQSFHPLPDDLRSRTVQALSEGTLFKHISYGVPGGRQPALATTVAIPDRWKIIAYLKSLTVRSAGKDASIDPQL